MNVNPRVAFSLTFHHKDRSYIKSIYIMNYDKNLLNKVLTDCKFKDMVDSSSIRFLTGCEILNKYMNDSCSVFNKNIIPIGLMPPGPRLDHVILRGADILDDASTYPLVPEVLVGDTIEYESDLFQ